MRYSEVLVLTKSTTKRKILNWKVSTTNNVETAIEKLQQRPYKVVAISKEISQTDKLKLNRLKSVLFENVILVEYNDDSTLQETVIRSYWLKNKPGHSNNYLDNSFELKLANSIKLN